MRKSGLIILVIIMFGLIGCSADFARFDDDSFSFQIDYPKNAVVYPVTDSPTKTAQFILDYPSTDSDQLVGITNISIEEKYTDVSSVDYLVKDFMDSIEAFSIPVEIVSIEDIEVDGINGKKLTEKINPNDSEKTRTVVEIMILKGENYYNLRYDIEPENFDLFIDVFDKMVGSMKID